MAKRPTKSKPKQTSKSLLYPFIELNRSNALKVFIIIIVGLALLVFAPVYLQKTTLSRELSPEATDSRKRSEPIADRKHQDKVERLLSTQLFDKSAPILSEKTDTCVLKDQGGIYSTYGWKQYCSFMYIDYIPTNYSKAELFDALASKEVIQQTFGPPVKNINNEGCVIFENKGREIFTALEYFSVSDPLDMCKSFKNSTTGNIGEIVAAPLGNSYIHKNFKTSDINTSKAYVRVQSYKDYYASREFCKRTLIRLPSLTCESPIASAVSGFNR